MKSFDNRMKLFSNKRNLVFISRTSATFAINKVNIINNNPCSNVGEEPNKYQKATNTDAKNKIKKIISNNFILTSKK